MSILKDERFAGILRDPKFKKPRRNERKVRIDKRFESMFKSDAFKVKYSVDKRGRRVSTNTTEDLKRFYDLPSEDERDSSATEDESESNESEQESISKEPKDSKPNDKRGCRVSTSTTEDSKRFHDLPPEDKSDSSATEDESESNESEQESISKEQKGFPKLNQDEDDKFRKKQITPQIRAKLKDMKVDYARGEGKLFSESSSDESESEGTDRIMTCRCFVGQRSSFLYKKRIYCPNVPSTLFPYPITWKGC